MPVEANPPGLADPCARDPPRTRAHAAVWAASGVGGGRLVVTDSCGLEWRGDQFDDRCLHPEIGVLDRGRVRLH